MQDDVAAAIRTLVDRQAILDCLTAYCRGLDRLDRDLALSAYHPDAVDDHGLIVAGPEAFVDWALGLHTRVQHRTQHIITNHTCELDGDVAHTETYYIFAGMNREGAPLNLGGGRYIDRLERRNGRWAIAARKCVSDWGGAPGPSFLRSEAAAVMSRAGPPSRDRTDPSYDRPLTIDPERIGFNFPHPEKATDEQ
jgi:hypothetical protein